ncbi:MAG TPA: hypothetical protein VNQ52_05985 [Microbacteriaceae bacterium]|nr:hypothetical protein [Microbacteriaceae bacterium]
MRTTITLTPEAQALVEGAMRERGAKFKDVVNDAILTALRPAVPEEPFVQRTFDLGWSLTSQQMKELYEQEEIEKYAPYLRGSGDNRAAD